MLVAHTESYNLREIRRAKGPTGASWGTGKGCSVLPLIIVTFTAAAGFASSLAYTAPTSSSWRWTSLLIRDTDTSRRNLSWPNHTRPSMAGAFAVADAYMALTNKKGVTMRGKRLRPCWAYAVALLGDTCDCMLVNFILYNPCETEEALQQEVYT